MKGTSTISGYELKQNYSNPFNPETTIEYFVPGKAYVEIELFDLLGQVRKLVAGDKNCGRYQVVWDGLDDHGTQVSSGVYLYTVTAGQFKGTHKLLLIK